MEKQVKTKNLPKSQIEIEITLPWKLIEKYIEKVVQEYGKKKSIPGFRPGKAPAEKIEKLIGRQTIIQEAVERAVKEEYVNTIIEKEIPVIGAPKIDLKPIKPNQDFSFKAIASIFPKLELCDIKSLKIQKPDLRQIKVQEKEINKTIDRIRKMRAKLITVNREAKKNDRVEIDFQLFMGGAPYEGGSSTNHPLVLGDKQNRFLPEFEKKLYGMKAGEEKTFSLTFPKKYHDSNLQGKKGEFKVKMKLVQKQDLPKLDDEFAKTIGKFKNVAEMKKNIKQNLKKEKENKMISEKLDELMDKIVQSSKIEIPEVLIEEEKEKMFQELEANVQKMGLDIDSYLKQINQTKKEILNSWDKEAEKRITSILAFREIADRENFKIDKEQIKQKKEALKIHDPQISEKSSREELNQYAKNLAINEKAVDWLKTKILGVKD
ncbi:MAG: trigger factor [Candidatus Moranbacteria bacterium]|nr:trigger factor [Candidatus Moranbacteria bacterium]